MGDLAADEPDALQRDIIAQAREIASRAQGVTEQEIDTLLDEALAEIRGNRK